MSPGTLQLDLSTKPQLLKLWLTALEAVAKCLGQVAEYMKLSCQAQLCIDVSTVQNKMVCK